MTSNIVALRLRTFDTCDLTLLTPDNGHTSSCLSGTPHTSLSPHTGPNCCTQPTASATMAGACVVFREPAQGILMQSEHSLKSSLCFSSYSLQTSRMQTQLYSRSLNRYDDCNCTTTTVHMCTEAHNAPQQEKNRQKHFINLIPSENFTSQAVLDALGSVMQSTSIETSLKAQAHIQLPRQILRGLSWSTILRRK
jgi:hypothetical protein